MNVWVTTSIVACAGLSAIFLLIWLAIRKRTTSRSRRPSIWIRHQPFPTVDQSTKTIRQNPEHRSRSDGEVIRMSPEHSTTPPTFYNDLESPSLPCIANPVLLPLHQEKPRAQSDPCIAAVGLPDTPVTKESSGPLVKFSVIYQSSAVTLLVHVTGVTLYGDDLRRGSRGVFLEINLIDEVKDKKYQSRGGNRRKFQESGLTFAFPETPLQMSNRCSVRVVVYGKKFAGGLRGDRLLGLGVFPLARFGLLPDVAAVAAEKLLSHHSVKTKSKDGQLLVLLQYQVSSNRMKVAISKGQNIHHKMDTSKEEFYVMVHAVRGSQVEATRRTTSQRGPRPVWNQTFNFDMRLHTLHRYSIRIILMSTHCSPDNVDEAVGRVDIGPEASTDGQAHWQDVLRPMAIETAQWHTVEDM